MKEIKEIKVTRENKDQVIKMQQALLVAVYNGNFAEIANIVLQNKQTYPNLVDSVYDIQNGVLGDDVGSNVVWPQYEIAPYSTSRPTISQEQAFYNSVQKHEGSSLLSLAIYYENLEVVRFVVEQLRADVNAWYYWGRQPIMLAAQIVDASNIFEYLVSKGANLNFKFLGETSLLSLAIKANKQSIVESLFKHKEISAEEIKAAIEYNKGCTGSRTFESNPEIAPGIKKVVQDNLDLIESEQTLEIQKLVNPGEDDMFKAHTAIMQKAIIDNPSAENKEIIDKIMAGVNKKWWDFYGDFPLNKIREAGGEEKIKNVQTYVKTNFQYPPLDWIQEHSIEFLKHNTVSDVNVLGDNE